MGVSLHVYGSSVTAHREPRASIVRARNVVDVSSDSAMRGMQKSKSLPCWLCPFAFFVVSYVKRNSHTSSGAPMVQLVVHLESS